MKKTFILLLLLASFSGFSQAVSIDTSTYTPEQLINSVLIDSPCFIATGVTASTGTNFGSTNGIGYFENFNPLFPFQKGIVLTTGDVTKVPSPNNTILSDGSNAWTGDTDLESNLLSQSGVTINSINASSITFEFIATTTAISFDFVFASEEYGTSQCDYSDAFAFLIQNRNTMGPNTNIAIVPSTTNPISVATIRDAQFNPGCASVNASWFGAYNGGGFGPAINFNGQTKQMTAIANSLVIGNTYRIKIVIADGGNNAGYDSAIFLKANSFNVNPEILGTDIALCPGAPLPTLQPTTTLPAGTTFQWKRNGVAFTPAQTGSSLNLASPSVLPAPTIGINTYTLTFTQPGCSPLTDDIKVELYAPLNVTTTIPPILLCNTGAPTYTFDLTKNIATLSTGQITGTIIKFYATNALAQNGTAGTELPTSHTIPDPGTSPVTVFARITHPTNSCYEVRSFELRKIATPVINAIPASITLCQNTTLTGTTVRANFNLTQAISDILGTQDPQFYKVTFHSSATSTTPININNPAIFPSVSRNLFVRVTNVSDATCVTTSGASFFQLIVTPAPLVDEPANIVVLPGYALPALTQPGAKYFQNANGGGAERPTGYVINATTTVHIFNQSGTCTNSQPWKITIARTTPVGNSSLTPANVSACNTFSLEALPYGNYYKLPGGPSTPLQEQYATGYNITTPGINTIYTWFEDPTSGSSISSSFTVTIHAFTPLVATDFPNRFGCNPGDVVLTPPAGVTFYNGAGKTGGVVAGPVMVSQNVYAYKESLTSPDCNSDILFSVTIGSDAGTLTAIQPPSVVNSCSATTLPAITVGEYRTDSQANGGGTVITNYNVNATTTVWFNVPGQSCAEKSVTVNVSLAPLPPIPDVGPVCDVFYLQPVAHAGDYYTGPLGTGAKRPVGYPITSTTTLYFYDKAPTGTCFLQEDIVITINQSPAITAMPIEVIRCNEPYQLGTLANGHYYSLPGGPAANPGGTRDGTSVTASETIWVYAAALNPLVNTCFQQYSIDVEIVNTIVNPVNNAFACDSYNLPPITGLGSYYALSGGPATPGNTSYPVGHPITTPGVTRVYIYAENLNRITCSDEKFMDITIYTTPVVAPITPVVMCDTYSLPAFVAPATRYFTLPGGPAGGGVEKFVGDAITTSQTVYAYAESGTLGTQICFDEEPLAITINNTPVIPALAPVFACDSYILPAFTAPVTRYFASNSIASTELFPGNPINASTTVYAYAETGTAPNCTKFEPMSITIYTTPVVAPITPVVMCDTYSLPALVAPATRYFTLPDGPAGGGVEKFVGDAITTSQTVYAYAESGTLGTQICFDEEPLAITINNTPVIPALAPVFACDSYTLPAFTAPATRYFASNSTASTELFPGNPINASTTVYAYAETGTAPNCTKFEPMSITIYTTPVVAPITPVVMCDTYSLPAFVAPATRYFTLPGGPAGGGVEKFVGDAITTSQTVYAYAESGTLGTQICFDEEPLAITINNTPVISGFAPVFACDSYTLPAFTAPATRYFASNSTASTELFPGNTINASTTVYAYAETGTAPNCTKFEPMNITITTTPVFVPAEVADVNVCDSYTLPALSTPNSNYYTGPNGTGTIIPATTTFTTSQLIYVYAANGTVPNQCTASEDIAINIFNVETVTDVVNCGPFNLNTLPALTSGAQYYSLPNGVSPITQVTASQVVYIFANAPFGTCSDQTQFNVTINAIAVANPVPANLTTVCDTDANVDDHVTAFDLDSLTATVLGSQNPTFYEVAYYPSLGDANMTTNKIVTDNGTNTDTSLSEVWVRVSNNTSAGCEDIERIIITVIPQPHSSDLTGTICIDSETGQVTPETIVSGYSSSLYTFDWKDNAGVTVSTAPNFIPADPGTYSLVITAIGVSGCQSAPIGVTVIESAKPSDVTFEISNWFSDFQTITVTATAIVGDGSNFRYSIDGQTPQVSNIFDRVSSSVPHEITVIDINGCGEAPVPIGVPLVFSPKFFSPNGDGVNDVWRIGGLENQPDAKLYIFDRFGKLLTEVFVNNTTGWDGTVNGQPLPGNDYWFTITYRENGVPKEFKSHFALVR